MIDTKPCPCNSGRCYTACCQPLLSGQTEAATAETLMRSRYSGYVAGDIAYLLRTWHPSTRPPTLAADTILNWCGLEIIRTEKGQEEDVEGIVEFKATACSHPNLVQLHETSRFVKEEGLWFYVAGDMTQASLPTRGMAQKVGRNSPCPCGSGKKFKKCCGH